ncbi:hypothetical protein [Gracilimonas sp.]|uniref:hypothetical protein n=1 Tax=Gracilimonas sp. TaxID=1974203 RepID=UPI0032EDDE40
MDLSNKTIWQQACGDTDRNYSKVCLDWDVILNGPGIHGKTPDTNKKLRNLGFSSRKVTDLNRFALEMKDGDLVVLRLGTGLIHGIGVIVGDYQWLDIFGDIDGWDLQHVRRVKWLKKFYSPIEFDTYTLKQGDTTQILDSDTINDWIQSLDISEEEMNRELVQLPTDIDYSEVSHEDISEFLFAEGVASNSINRLTEEIDELQRIAKWYQNHTIPSEHETVAYLVAPLLRALGWTPQKMAVEWNRVDVALFKSLPREDQNLTIVVEAKKKGYSCLTARSQAESYAINRSGCDRLIVTDGLRYGIYFKKDDDFNLYAYMNLTNLRSSHPIYKCRGTQHALLAITPEWNPN